MAFDLFFEVRAARAEVERARRASSPVSGHKPSGMPRHHRLGRRGDAHASATHPGPRGAAGTSPPL